MARPSRFASSRRTVLFAATTFLLLATVVGPARATIHCGPVCDETWTAAQNPHVLSCWVDVPAACSLTIEAGAEVRVQGMPTELMIEGTLDVLGTASDPVTFTSDMLPTPATGDWTGITIYGGATATFDHANVMFGQYGILAQDSSTVTLNHVTVSDNVDGVWVQGNASVTLTSVTTSDNVNGIRILGNASATLTNVTANDNVDGIRVEEDSTLSASECILTANQDHGLYVDGPADVSITRSSIHSNLGAYDLSASGGGAGALVLLARENWWGEQNPASIRARIDDEADYASGWIVDWCGYLDAAGGDPVVDRICPDLSVCDTVVDWDQTDRAYQLINKVRVCETGTLRVGPGVEVRAPAVDPRPSVVVLGNLEVNGTSDYPVTFTSEAPVPQPQDWGGIGVGSTVATANLSHVTVEYADHGLHAGVQAAVTLDHLISRFNLNGLYIDGSPSVDAIDCAFIDNAETGVKLGTSTYPQTSLTITRSSIHGSGGEYDFDAYGLSGGPTVVHARENWWDETDAPTIEARIRDHLDHAGSATVDWCGYLGGPPPSATSERDLHCPEIVACDGTVVWNLTDKPYHLVTDVLVCPTGRLEIGPGVEVQVLAGMSGKPGFDVEGELDVNGTGPDPVVVTSDAPVPQPADWRSVEFFEGSVGTLDFVEILYANLGVAISSSGTTSVTLDHVTARWNRTGLNVWVQGENPVVTVAGNGCTFTDNEFIGVYIGEYDIGSPRPDPSVSITNSSIDSSSGAENVHVDSGMASQTVFDFRDNWWGTADPETIRSRISIHSASYGAVDWCRYRTADGGPPVLDAHCPDLRICGETSVWDQIDKPYQLVTDLQVCPSGALTVGPAVQMRAVDTSDTPALTVEGILDVNGVSGSAVTFVSDSATPLPGDWGGLQLLGAATASIDEATILHADRAIDAGGASVVTLNGVTAQLNNEGLHVEGGGSPTVSAWGCDFSANEVYGVDARGTSGAADPSVDIFGSSIYGNLGSYDFYAATNFATPNTTVLEARGNYWGTDDTTAIAQRIYDRSDNAGSARVEWCAYLDAPGGTAPDVECPDKHICDRTEVWFDTARPYQITGDVYICPTGTLQILSGVEVRFVKASPALTFVTEGTLDVNGTEGAPVRFTSDSTTPAAGDWSGLLFTGVIPCTIDHATVEYGTYGIQTEGNVDLTVTGATLWKNGDGLNVHSTYGDSPVVNITESKIIQNEWSGIYLYEGYASYLGVTINRSEIHSNLGSYDYNPNSTGSPHKKVLNARENWWGSDDPDVFGPRILDYRVNNQRPLIDFCRYLDGPGGEPVVDAHCPDLAVCDETVTLDLTDKPYQVTSDMYVCGTGTLNVEPGVTLLVAAGSPVSDIRVNGPLNVNGTEADPVVFASDADVPQPGDWGGLLLGNFSTHTMDHSDIAHAVTGIYATGGADVTLDNVHLHDNTDGLYVFGFDPPTVHVGNSMLINNVENGVDARNYTGRANPTLVINGSSIHSNGGSYDLRFSQANNPGRTVVDARGNWWGTPEAVDIGPRIYDHRRSDSAPIVDFCDYLDGENGDPVRDTHCPDLAPCGETVILDQTDRPYLLTSDMIVCDTGTLQIEPGVETRTVLTTPRPDFLVNGVLDVNGTRASPVTFGPDTTTPQVGDWIGVKLAGSSSSTLDHADIAWADMGIYVTDNGTATLEGVTLHRNNDGLYIVGSGTQTVNAAGCFFTDNDRYGIRWQRTYGYGPDLTVTRSALHSNLGAHDLYTTSAYNVGGRIVWATDNWWGTTDEATIRSRIRDHDESGYAPRVYYQAFGDECDYALGRDGDGDGLADFEDNCPNDLNPAQGDIDGDLMGDACDPEPGTVPSSECDGFNDELDGYLDTDGDGWGDPCDHQPTRADSYPGATELCDGRDNDGDALFGPDEKSDADYDLAIACGDCDEAEPEVHACACEECLNAREDDCDGLMDGADPDCQASPSCIFMASGVDPFLTMARGECGGATLSGPFDVIGGSLSNLQFSSGSVDLGVVECVQGGLDWDRVTDWSPAPNRACDELGVLFFLGRNTGDPDFGWASSGEPRDIMDPDPPCAGRASGGRDRTTDESREVREGVR